ncbi:MULTISPECIES: hypothetical protein [unclassified Desulfovibrio]|uniref:hypothetical protein n=1 Tax=unclassified Desulfovibrio TaxID=2593640 RepID=UPI002FD91297
MAVLGIFVLKCLCDGEASLLYSPVASFVVTVETSLSCKRGVVRISSKIRVEQVNIFNANPLWFVPYMQCGIPVFAALSHGSSSWGACGIFT